jgi:hypothetical protein
MPRPMPAILQHNQSIVGGIDSGDRFFWSHMSSTTGHPSAQSVASTG